MVVSNFKALDTKRRGEEKGWWQLCQCRLVAFAGGNPPGSVPKPPEGQSHLGRNIFVLGEVERASHKLNEEIEEQLQQSKCIMEKPDANSHT